MPLWRAARNGGPLLLLCILEPIASNLIECVVCRFHTDCLGFQSDSTPENYFCTYCIEKVRPDVRPCQPVCSLRMVTVWFPRSQQKALEVSRLSPVELAVLNGTAPAGTAITIEHLENKISDVSDHFPSCPLCAMLLNAPPALPCDGRRSRMRSTSARARKSSPTARPLCRR